MEHLPIPFQKFNERIRVLNQTRAKDLFLTAEEARNLHTEIFSLLARLAVLEDSATKDSESIQVQLDGDSWS
jgi:hypothetical protein